MEFCSKYDKLNASYFYITRAFVRDEVDIDILEPLLALGELGIQYCLKSEKAFTHLTERIEGLETVDFYEYKKMHEISVLKQAVDIAEQTALENNIPKTACLTLEVGEPSGYLPVFFHKYYPIVIENRPMFEGPELKIISAPGEALCKECSAMYNVMREEGRCPKCGSRSKTILGGQEFRIKEICIPETD